MTGRSIQASPKGIQLAKQALTTKRWKQTNLIGEICSSRATVSKFFNGKRVDDEIFVALCEKLGLDWQEIADLPKGSVPELADEEQDTDKKLRYFCYISRAKVNQLYDQLTDFAVEKKLVKLGRSGEASAEAGGNKLFGLLKGDLKFGGRYTRDIEEIDSETIVQKLKTVINHIEKHEKVLDLAQLCKKKEGVTLDAFCYTYAGNFFALGTFGRDKYSSITISEDALSKAGDEILISKRLLIEPGREENALKEGGPNNSSLVSNICIINSTVGSYTLSLACSYKYFSDMGGSWNERKKEWAVYPHSGNHHFFEGECDTWFESLVFVNGIRGNTIMGTPIFLLHSAAPSLRI